MNYTPSIATNLCSEYRFGFNGQEKDDEVTGQTGSLFSAQFWEYDSRIGRRWNLDPKPNPSISFYATFADNPVRFCDVLGDSVRTKISRSLRRELGLTRKEAKNYTPRKISKVFEQEYGMNVEVRNGWLRYTGESKFQPESYSSTAKEMWRKELSDNYKSKDKIVLTNKGYEHNFAYKTSYINLSNFANDLTNVSVNYSDPDNVNLKRAYNLGRSFEHEFLGHGVMKLKDFTTAMSYEDVDGYEEFILGKQTALKLVNSFISEMGLQDYQRLFYGIYFQGGHMIFFGNPSKPFTPIHVITY